MATCRSEIKYVTKVVDFGPFSYTTLSVKSLLAYKNNWKYLEHPLFLPDLSPFISLHVLKYTSTSSGLILNHLKIFSIVQYQHRISDTGSVGK
jgi:hypothetical protein